MGAGLAQRVVEGGPLLREKLLSADVRRMRALGEPVHGAGALDQTVGTGRPLLKQSNKRLGRLTLPIARQHVRKRRSRITQRLGVLSQTLHRVDETTKVTSFCLLLAHYAPTDTDAGKRTLAVRLGDQRTRGLYALLVVVAAAAVVAVAAATTWWALLGLGFLARIAGPTRDVLRGATGPALIPVLAATGISEVIWAALVAAPLVVLG